MTESQNDPVTPVLEIAGASRAKRAVNEDAFLVDEAHLVFGVFDGLGATSEAARAAELAAEAIHAAYEERDESGRSASEEAFLSDAVEHAGQLIAENLDDGLTTASVVKVIEAADGTVTALIANIGDSRVYRFTVAGELKQCTLDDSMLSPDWDLQLYFSEVAAMEEPDDYVYFGQRHFVDRALGEGDDRPQVWKAEVNAGDLLLAVTDGVTDNLTFSELRELLRTHQGPPELLARELVDAAHARSQDMSHARAKIDDITAVVARIGRPPGSG
jgi:serine/threonine protein phosphatase PrpC